MASSSQRCPSHDSLSGRRGPARRPRPGYRAPELATGDEADNMPGCRATNASASPPTACARRRGPAAPGPRRPLAHPAGRWFLPGGGVQHGEHPIESLRREFEEESGPDGAARAPARCALRRAHPARRDQPAHGSAVYRVESWRARCGPSSTGPPTPSGGSDGRAGPRSPGALRRKGGEDPLVSTAAASTAVVDDPPATTSSSSAAASAASSPPRPSSGRRCGSP